MKRFAQFCFRSLFIVSLFLPLSSRLQAAQWFVSPSGSNTNTGLSTASPWRTLQFANDTNAVGNGDTINVMSGNFVENLTLSKALLVRNYNGASVSLTAPSSASNSALIIVNSANVTISGLNLAVNCPNATAGIIAINRNALSILNCSIQRSGSGGSYTVTSSNFSESFSSIGVAFVGDNASPWESMSMSGCTVGSASNPFQRAMWMRATSGTIGGSSTSEANSFYGSSYDFVSQYAGSTNLNIASNTFGASGVLLDEPNIYSAASSFNLNCTSNTFSTSSSASQALFIRHNYQASTNISVSSNSFSGHSLGILCTGSRSVSISSNNFTAGANGACHIRVNSATSGVSSNFVQNSLTLLGNSFSNGSFSAVKAVELLDDNAGVSGQPTPDFSSLVIGQSSARNTFAAGLGSCITLGSGFSLNLNAAENFFGLSSSSPILPSAMSTNQLFELEDKINDHIDNPTLGFVRLVSGHLYVTTNSFQSGVTSAPSIQRAIDVSASGDSIMVQAGTYTETLSLTNSVHIVGDALSSNLPTSILDAGNGTAITSTGSAPKSFNRFEIHIGSSTAARFGMIPNSVTNSGNVNLNFALFRRGTQPVGGLVNPGTQGVDIPANIDDGNDFGPNIGVFTISNLLGCPQTFNVSAASATVCETDSLILLLSGNQSGVSYTAVINGVDVNSSQTVLNTGVRRFAIPSQGSGSFQSGIRASLGQCAVMMNGSPSIEAYSQQTPALSLNSINQILCAGTAGQITVINSEPQASYAVYDGSSIVGSPKTGNNGSLVFPLAASLFPPSGQKTFSVRASASANANCFSETANGSPDGATFTVYPLPAAPVITTNNPTACSPGGNAIVIVTNAQAGYTYQVVDGNTAVYSVTSPVTGVFTISNIPVTPAVPGLGLGARTVRVYAINPNNNNCRVLSQNSLTITVSQRPTKPLMATGTTVQSYCETGNGVTAQLVVANGDASLIYRVIDSTTSQQLVSVNGQSGMFMIDVPGLTSAGSVYKLRVVSASSSSGCESEAGSTNYITVSPQPLPVISLTGSSQSGAISVTACLGYTTPFVLTSSTNMSSASYQWLLNGNVINGATTSSYTVATGLNLGNYVYTLRQVSASGCVGFSNSFNLTVAQPIDINLSLNGGGTSTSFFSGTQNSIVINSTVTPAGYSPSYSWLRNNSVISGVNAASYQIPSSTAPGSYSFTAIASTSSGCSDSSNVISVTVWPLPQLDIFVQANNRNDSAYAAGLNPPVLASTISGAQGQTVSYQWYGPNSSTNAISGATASTFTPPSNLSPGVYRYILKASLGGVSVNSDTVTITVLVPASVHIYVQANNRNDSTYFAGIATPVLASQITNSNNITFSYQWFGPNSGGAISGATNSTFAAGVLNTPGTYRYRLVISGGGQVVSSDTVVLTVLPAPQASAYVQPNHNQKDSTTFRSVQAPSLGVDISGSNGYAISYQWYGPNSNSPISGATTNSYQTPSNLSPGTYRYTVRATLGGLTVSSDTVTIIVLADPSITAFVQPNTAKKDTTYFQGQNAPTMGSALQNAAGRTPTYQWFSAENAQAISGATASSYQLPNSLSIGTHRYIVKAIFAGLSVWSDTVSATILPAFSVDVYVQPGTKNDSSYFQGVNPPTFGSTVLNGNGLQLSYQWYGPNAPTAISGATNSSYTPPSNLSPGTYDYILRVTGGGITVASDTIHIVVLNPPTAHIFVQPNQSKTDSTYFRSVNAPTLSSTITGNVGYPVTYQWYGPNNNSPISGATNSSFGVPNALSPGVYRYTMKASLGGLTVGSDTVTITILADPQLDAYVVPHTSQNDTTYYQGQQVPSLASILTNNNSITPQYQWYRTAPFSALSGATSSSVFVPSNLTPGVYHFVLRASFPGLTVSSDTITVTVLAQPVIHSWVAGSANVTNATMCSAQSSVSLVSSVDGGQDPINYQWYRNGGAISGATNSSYAIPSSLTTGTYYFLVQATTGGMTIFSNLDTVTVFAAPNPTMQLLSGTLNMCQNGASQTVLRCTMNGVQYQWRQNGLTINGATNQTYTVPNSLSPDSYVYSVRVVDANGCVGITADSCVYTVVMHAQPNPSVGIQNGQSTYCAAATINTVMTTQSGYAAYQWKVNGSVIAGATQSSYTLSGTLVSGTYQYSVSVVDAYGCSGSSSNSVQINVVEPPTISWSMSSQDLCYNYTSSTTMSVSVSGCSSTPTLQWFVDGEQQIGATSSSFSIPTGLSVGSHTLMVQVNCGGCVSNSTPAVINVFAPPQINLSSYSQSLCYGYSSSTPIVASLNNCNGNVSYQWYKNGIALNGATSNTLTIPSGLAVGTTNFYLMAQCGPCLAQSATVSVEVSNAAVAIITNAEQSACVGYSEPVTFNVSIGNCNGSPAFQWTLNGSVIDGATSSQYTVPFGLNAGVYNYALILNCGQCSVSSNVAHFTVNAAPQISLSSDVDALCLGYTSSTTIHSNVVGCNAATYQWLLNGSAISGATNSSYTLPMNLNVGSYSYSLNVSCGGCSFTSSCQLVFVVPQPSISLSPASQTVCSSYASGVTVTASVSSCSAPSYQWFIDGVAVSGATTSVLIVPTGLSIGNHNIVVQVHSGPCTTVSSTHILQVIAPPTVTVSSTSNSLCVGYSTQPIMNVSVTGCSCGSSYQWLVNGSPISGATGSSYTLPLGLGNGSYSYQVIVTCGLCSVTSAEQVVVVNAPPSLTMSTTQVSLCANYSSTVTVSVSSSSCNSTPSYQWYLNNSLLSGATSSSYAIPTGLAVGTYTLSVGVKCGACSAVMATTSVLVRPNPTVSITTASSSVCAGYSNSLNLSTTLVNCSGTPFYQWYRNGSAISGATASQYSIPSGLSVGQYAFSVMVSCNGCTSQSNTMTFTVAQPPSVSLSQSATSMCSSYTGSLVLSSNLSGCSQTPTYQWFKNGSAISGATAANYTVPNGMAAGTYTYALSVQCGPCTVQSSNLTVTVNADPTVSISTTTISVCSSSSTTATLSSSLSSCSGIASYQWYLNSSAISGATNSSYTLPQGLSAGTYSYSLGVNCSGCSASSNTLVISVNSAPSVSVSTSASAWCTSSTTSPVLSATVTNCSCNPAFQWYVNNNPISGATASSYTLPLSTAPGVYSYSVSVQCAACTINSSTSVITVATPPTVSINQASQTACLGYSNAPLLSANVIGCSSNAQYQWYLNSTAIAGATNSSYQIPLGLSVGSYNYSVNVVCGPCSASSSAMSYLVNPQPSISISATQQQLCLGYSNGPVLSANLSSCAGSPSYQWYKNSVAISGASSASYTVPTGLTAGTYNYTVTVNCGGCSSTSSNLSVQISNPPSVSISGTTQALCANSSAFVVMNANLSGCAQSASYQWRLNGNIISGATSSSYTTPSNLGAGSYSFTVDVNCGACSAQSAAFVVVASAAPTLTISSAQTSVCSGYSAFTLTSSMNCGSSSSYQWYRNASPISGATSSIYTVGTGLAPGSYSYSLVANCGVCTSTSNTIVVVVNAPPQLSISSSTNALCVGYSSGASLTASMSGCNTNAGYQWTLNGSTISGATNSTYQMPSGWSAGNYTFGLNVVCGSCTVQAATQTVSVSNAPGISLSASVSSVCSGYSTAPVLSATVSGCSSNPSYQWRLNNAPISGATNASYTLPTSLAAGVYSYTLSVVCGCCSATSSALSITVQATPTLTISSTQSALCSGYSNGPTLSSNLSGCASASYQWQKNGVDIAGATNATYTVPTGLSIGNTTFALRIVCGSCTTSSNSVVISVTAPPTVSIQASASSVCAGSSTMPTVSASVNGCSTAASYQWYVNSSPISGATSSSYQFPSYTSAGNYSLTCTVQCGVCSVQSASTNVTVTSAPTVILNASSTSLCAGSGNTITISSSVSGCTCNPAYQWYQNGSAISGATGASYVVPSSLAIGNYQYTVTVSCSPCSASSSALTINVNAPPSVSVSPSSQQLCAGYTNAQTLTANVTGCASTLSYQWYKGATAISGATNQTYTPASGMAVGNYSYSVLVQCGSCSAASSSVSVNVQASPTVTLSLVNGSLSQCVGYANACASISATASGCTGTPSYQWTVNGYDISGATNAQYPIPSGLGVGSYVYAVRIACGPCTSQSASTLTFNVVASPNPSISASATSFCSGSSTTSLLSVSGGSFSSYQWKLNGSAISGATSSSYTVPSGLTVGVYSYTVTVSNGICSATSAAQTITVNSGPSVSVSTNCTSICSGSTAAIVFTLSGGNSSNWNLVYSNGSQTYTVNSICGSTYTIAVSPAVTTIYSVVSVSSGGCSSTTSSSVTINVYQSPAPQTISSTDANVSNVCAGTTKIYTIPSVNSANTYAWSVIGGSGMSTSQLSAGQFSVTFPTSMAGSTVTIRCIETTPQGCQRVNTVNTTINALPANVTVSVGSSTICQGSSTTLSITSPQSGVSYSLWNGATQVGSTLNSAPISWTVSPSQIGTTSYTVKAVNSIGCAATVASAQVTVVAGPTVTISADATSICPGTSAVINFQFTGQGPWTLVYKVNANANTTVSTSANPYSITQTLNSTTQFTVISVSNSLCSGTVSGGNAVTVSVAGLPTQSYVLGLAGDDATMNSASKVTFWDNNAGSGTNYPDGNVNTSSDSYRPTKYPNYAVLNNHAGIYFDGNDQPVTVNVNTGCGISGGTQKSWYMLYRPVTTSLSTARMVLYKQGDANHGMCIYLINKVVYYGMWNNQNCCGTCTNKWAVFQNTGFTVQANTNYIFQLVYNGNASTSNRVRFSINGTMYTPSATAGTSMDYSGDVVSVAGKVGNTRFHDGASENDCSQYNLSGSKIAEVLVYNSCDLGLRNQVWCVLKNKYAMSSLGNNPIGVLAKASVDEEFVAGLAPNPRYELSEAQPNPSINSAMFTLRVDEQQYVKMTLVNEIGQEISRVFEGPVARQSANGFTVDVSILPSGHYFLRVEADHFATVRPFVVVH